MQAFTPDLSSHVDSLSLNDMQIAIAEDLGFDYRLIELVKPELEEMETFARGEEWDEFGWQLITVESLNLGELAEMAAH